MDNYNDNQFIIDTDQKAEWAIRKIAEHQAEAQRFIEFYKQQAEIAKKNCENACKNLNYMLKAYFQTVPAKVTKTQATYKLPSGTLKLKFPTPVYKRDEEKLLKYLQAHGYDDYIETKISPKWGEFKKQTITQDNVVIDPQTGEVVDGVTVEQGEEKFIVEVNTECFNQ